MPDQSVVDRVRELYAEVLGDEAPPPGTDLIDTGLLDSLALVELVFALEQAFQLRLSLDTLEIETFRNFESIAEFVEASRSAASA
jgi:acyl carrier protein